ncbi:MAG TPA: L,D-transpeptidase [Ignavibacteriaceae bacterium]|nr:L,D-transpeptidase [Ignavibacteriaceae bacterium]
MKKISELKSLTIGPIKVSNYLNSIVARNIIYMTFAIILFFFGVIIYGIVLNLRQVSLSEAMEQNGLGELKNISLVIERKTYTLSIYEDEILVKSYRASFGRLITRPKVKAGDGATPVGEYRICNIDTLGTYYKFFKINYPNLDDAVEALKKGWISQREFNDIKFQYYYENCTRYHRILGGNIGIHGIGRFNYILKNLPFVFNWTDGSIALSDEDIDELNSIIKIGTKVVIK